MPDLMTLAGIALKTSLVVAAAGLLSIALRRQSAAFRHALWMVALALCVVMPVAVIALPTHQVAALPAVHASDIRAVALNRSMLLALWLTGSTLVLFRELLGTLGLARWLRHAQPLTSPRWTTTLARFDHPHLRVLESQHIASPCTWGVLRPVLLLPTAGDTWPESARHAALMHELAHIQRRDAITTLIARLACVMHWYNPLVWFAAKRVRNLQERACDDAVLLTGAMPSDYAQFLLDVAAHMSGTTRPARLSIGMTHGSSLRARIVAILDPQVTRARPQRVRLVATCASLVVVTLLLATASVAVEPPPTELLRLRSTPQLPRLPVLPTLPVPPISPVAPELV